MCKSSCPIVLSHAEVHPCGPQTAGKRAGHAPASLEAIHPPLCGQHIGGLAEVRGARLNCLPPHLRHRESRRP